MSKHHYKNEHEFASKGEVIVWNFHHDDYRIVRITSGDVLVRYEVIAEIIR
jgi:hypothetical protein